MRKINRETHWVLAGIVYFAAVFAAGFILGIIRVGLLVPQVGVRVAELIEMPLMIVATLAAARWVVYCWGVGLARRAALLAGIWALSLLVAAEIALGVLQGLPLSNFILGRDPVSGTAYFAALVLFALMPWIVARGAERSRAAERRFSTAGQTKPHVV
jgi:hypothetical protein